MLKLSILIAAQDDALLEATLVSVLQNRPPDCEIVVVHDDGYDDPYELADEVRFHLVRPEADELARLNHGLAECRAAVVHVLRCGAEVTDGWTKHALDHFADPQVAAVAPLLVTSDGERIEAAGLDYHRGGKRIARQHAAEIAMAGESPQPVLGPALNGAFYRLAALRAGQPSFRPTLGVELCDIDLALRLAEAGYRAILEPRSRISAHQVAHGVRPLSDAWLAERLFWRHARELRHVASHLSVVAAETLAHLARPLRAGSTLGRIAGLLEYAIRGTRDSRGHGTSTPHPPRKEMGSQIRLDRAASASGPNRSRGARTPRAA